MTHDVYVRAACRLHFGMFGFGHRDQPQFGGVGAMVDPPAVEVAITPAAQLAVNGALAERVQQFANFAAAAWHLPSLPPCEIAVRSPSDHVGLGVGTQLGLSVAAGLRRFLKLSDMPAATLAVEVGRGKRSAVGTHGFEQGGLIVDAGHVAGLPIGALAQRVAVPSDWRFVLVSPVNQRGLAGRSEADAFARVPPVPDDVSRQLWQITEGELLPAVVRRDCHAFGDAVYRFGRLAGECFAAVQGGPFASPEIAHWIAAIREFGIPGVGQSSWGPTVFAVCPSDMDARALVEMLHTQRESLPGDVSIAEPHNQGAVVTGGCCDTVRSTAQPHG